MLLLIFSMALMRCISLNAKINDNFLEEVSNENNYSLMNCPPEWWDRGFVLSKPSNRAFLFKYPTKDFDTTIEKLKRYGYLFNEHEIRFSFLNDSKEYEHLVKSFVKNMIQDEDWSSKSERYQLSYTSADTFETTLIRKNDENNEISPVETLEFNGKGDHLQLYKLNMNENMNHPIGSSSKIGYSVIKNSFLFMFGSLGIFILLVFLIFIVYKKRK